MISYILISHYLYGDQIVYRELYEALGYVSISEALDLSKTYVSGSEPFSAWILWFGASMGFDKDVYVSFFNLILLISIFCFLKINRASWVAIFLVLMNYYVLVLLTGAERLKFSYLFLLIAACLKGNARVFFMLCAPLAHFQSIIFLAGIGFGHLSGFFRSIYRRWAFPKAYIHFVVIFVVLLTAFLLFFGQKLIQKASVYIGFSGGASELIQVSILLIFSLIVSRDRLRIFMALIPMMAAVFLLGGNRVNMVAFSVVFYFLVLERRLSSTLSLVLLGYFSYKSIGFIKNVMLYGNAYY